MHKETLVEILKEADACEESMVMVYELPSFELIRDCASSGELCWAIANTYDLIDEMRDEDWRRIESFDIVGLLMSYPEYSEFFNLSKLDKEDWDELIDHQPQFKEQYKKYGRQEED